LPFCLDGRGKEEGYGTNEPMKEGGLSRMTGERPFDLRVIRTEPEGILRQEKEVPE
jgi:hypothetical protein